MPTVISVRGPLRQPARVSGEWVSPFEVESALAAHPAVLEGAVVPYEDENKLLRP
jgi:acyl-coenzyme A synthetase/AMP-(fatty) acid ligase